MVLESQLKYVEDMSEGELDASTFQAAKKLRSDKLVQTPSS